MKKIIAVIVVLIFAAMLFNINVSAENSYEVQMELKRQFELDYLALVSEYENGYITYDEFKTRADEITERYEEVNTDENGVVTSIAQNVSNTVKNITNGIGNAVGTVGDTVKEWIGDIFSGNETTESIPTTDMNGYGAYIVCYWSANANTAQCWYCDYIVVDDNTGNSKIDRYFYLNCPNATTTNADGILTYFTFSGDFNGSAPQYLGASYSAYEEADNGQNRYIYSVYGDVRYEDGTQAPTDDEYVDKETHDFSNMSDDELDELLQQLLEELARQSPDLSTIEGLLEAIYYRLGTLDSDNDNTLLGQVVSAINSLKESIENIDFDFDTDKEYNFEDIFGDFEFSIDFSDFFIDFEANIELYFTVEEGYFNTKFTDLKDDFNSEFAFVDNITSYVKKIFDAFDALWEDNGNDTTEHYS